MKPLDWAELVGYAMGGVIAASRGDVSTAARCFILAATSLVPQDVAQANLTQASIDRANMAADVAEAIKFGPVSS